MADGRQDLAEESERLARLATETGDDRLMRAAALLADSDARDYRRDWRTKAKLTRNDAIREMSARYFADREPWQQAREIHRRLDYYAQRRWSRDRHALRCPADILDTLDGAIWALWSDTGAEIISQRTIYRLLTF